MCRRLASKAIVCRSHSVSKNLNVGWQSGHKFKKNPRAAAIAKYLEMTRVPKTWRSGSSKSFSVHRSWELPEHRAGEEDVRVCGLHKVATNYQIKYQTHISHDQTQKKKGQIGSVETRLKSKQLWPSWTEVIACLAGSSMTWRHGVVRSAWPTTCTGFILVPLALVLTTISYIPSKQKNFVCVYFCTRMTLPRILKVLMSSTKKRPDQWRRMDFCLKAQWREHPVV